MAERVVVEVSGGVAEVTHCPEGVDVIILDWDNCPACGGERCEGQGCTVDEVPDAD